MVEKVGSVDQIVSEILLGLHEGRYVPGQKLIESDLVRQLGVGRGTIREALRRLEAEGLTTASLHRGASIRIFSRDGIRDWLEVTEAIACLSARLAAQRYHDSVQLAGLRTLVGDLRRKVEAGESFGLARARYEILRQIVWIANNDELQRLIPRLDASVMRAQFRVAFHTERLTLEVEQFEVMIAAIAARDPEVAEQAMRAFVRNSAIAIQQLPDQYFAR